MNLSKCHNYELSSIIQMTNRYLGDRKQYIYKYGLQYQTISSNHKMSTNSIRVEIKEEYIVHEI